MNHEICMRAQTAEKYLLHELPPAERDAFEQHFFECPDCAEDIRFAFEFGENAKQVFREQPRTVARVSKPRNWFAWMRPPVLAPLAAGLAALAFFLYQNTAEIPALRARIAQLESPQVLSAIVLRASSRSSVPSVHVAPGSPFLQLTLAITSLTPGAQYRCEVRSAAGKIIASMAVPELDADSNLTLLIPAARLQSGSYDAVLILLAGGRAADVEHYRFVVQEMNSR